jgi:RNA polymerase sigma-70 factor (ECF subfamily)
MTGLLIEGAALLAADRSPADDEVGRRLEGHRAELRGHCRRMLGSASEVEDAVQETMVRAWRSYPRFEGRSSLRSWLRRIATNVCFDMMKAPQRRARPGDPATWTAPDPVAVAADTARPVDPADQALGREDVRQAFLAALLHLPPQQRSVLVLCEVLRWRASEVAELLGTSVASVNSSLQRARATLATLQGTDRARVPVAIDGEQRALVQRAAAAFASYDVGSLVALLR